MPDMNEKGVVGSAFNVASRAAIGILSVGLVLGAFAKSASDPSVATAFDGPKVEAVGATP